MNYLTPSAAQEASAQQEVDMFEIKGRGFFKVKKSHTYYLVDLNEYNRVGQQIEVRVYHLLRPDSYLARKSRLNRVSWDKIPEEIRERILKKNKRVRNLYQEYIKQEDSTMGMWDGLDENKTTKTTEDKTMTKTQFGIDMSNFGPINSDSIKLSPKGIAIKQSAEDGSQNFLVWDKEKNVMIDVTPMVMDMEGMLFLVPCKELKVGDIIKQHGTFVFVQEIDEKTGSIVTLGQNGRMQPQIKVTNMFGMDFYTKVVSLVELDGEGSIESMMKMAMMSSMMGGTGGMFGNTSGGNTSGGMGNMLQMQMMMSMFGKGDKNPLGDMFNLDNLFDFSK